MPENKKERKIVLGYKKRKSGSLIGRPTPVRYSTDSALKRIRKKSRTTKSEKKND